MGATSNSGAYSPKIKRKVSPDPFLTGLGRLTELKKHTTPHNESYSWLYRTF